MEIVDELRVEMEMEQKMCSSCKKSSSEYYELLLQIRFIYFEDMMNIKDKALTRILDTFNTVNRLEERDNGFDIYFRSHGEMNKIHSLFVKDYLIDLFALCLVYNKMHGYDNLHYCYQGVRCRIYL